MYITFRYIYI